MHTFNQLIAQAFEDELRKIAAVPAPSAGSGKYLLPAVAGSALTLAAIRANKDRQMGRQMRLQQQQGY